MGLQGRKSVLFGVSLRGLAADPQLQEPSSSQQSEALSVDNPASEEIKFQ